MKFNVTGQSIVRQSPEPLVSGTIGKYIAEFSFDASWDGLVATAVFKATTLAGITKVERKAVLVDNVCEVPFEVLQDYDRVLWVGVYGLGASGILVVPTVWCRVNYIKNGASTDASPGQDPTPTIAEQMSAEFAVTRAAVAEDASRAEAAADRAENTGGSGGGAGKDGLSAYEIAVKNGFVGTEPEWLNSLQGENGAPGLDGKNGEQGPIGPSGLVGMDGKSAYEVAIDNGFTGTEAEWLASLKADGDMLASVYDPTGRNRDIFDYTDKVGEFLDQDIGIIDGKIIAHSLDMRNPHNVTAEQVGAAASNLSNVPDADFASKAAAAGVGGGSALFDVVIRTQAEFDALIASPTWLDAVSVCFVGDGGALKFTRSDGLGCKIPQTVKQIQGVNGAIIEVTEFNYNRRTNSAALWYGTWPTSTDYWVNGLTVNCVGVGNVYGFCYCAQLSNCTGIATSTEGIGADSSLSCAFMNCTNLTNCTAVVTALFACYGFRGCGPLSRCIGTASAKNGYGVYDCRQLSDCTGIGNASSDANGYGFVKCTQLSNCMGSGSSLRKGYSFYDCDYLNGCKQGTPPPTTGFLGGTNTKVDTATVVAS